MHKNRIIYWTLGLFIALMCASLSYYYFSSAIPFVAVDITMNREAALQQAAQLAQENNWGPQPHMQAALFELDAVTRNYIELEAGGRQKLQEIIDNHQYELYTWRVRHMQEDNPHQAIFYFTPEGKWYGLQETLNEDAPGTSLTTEQAQTIAQNTVQIFDIALQDYTLVESSKKEARSKRIDHTFVYENGIKFGQSPLQLKITVSGDRVTEIFRLVKVPQEFNRRFESIRASNNLLFTIAQGIIYIIFIFFGCLVALFLMAKKSNIKLLAPLLLALGLILLQTLSTFNYYPLALFGYKTNYSTSLFLIQFIISIVLSSLSIFIVYGLSLASGTELSRRAFPENSSWRNFFTIKRAGSWHLIDLVGLGLLMACIHVTYVLLFYAYTMKSFGWWIPTDTLFNPNILSSYIPTLTPFARALNAGVWEEFLFRAVPIGGGALLGAYFGHKKLGMWLGFLTQVAVFGIAHANYPGIPGYSRLIELVAPSVMFGLTYIYFGIIPGIVSHWAYDLFWMSLPLLVSQASGSNVQRLIILLFILSPLIYTLTARYWHDDEDIDREEEEVKTYHKEAHVHHKEAIFSIKFIQLLAIPALLVGLVGSFIVIKSPYNYDTLKINAAQAQKIAQEYFANQNIPLDGFKPLIIVSEKSEPAQQYVRYILADETNKLDTSYRINGLNKNTVTFAKPPRFGVRFAQFDTGSLEERAREYAIAIEGDGTLRRVAQLVPESETKKSLTEEEARKVVLDHLRGLNVTPSIDTFKEMSAIMTKLPNRHDWTFIFEHEYTNEVKPRIIVKLAGDTITDVETTFFTPESYTRITERDKAILQLLQAVSAVILMLILLTLYLYQPVTITGWSLISKIIIGIIALLTGVGLINKLPLLMANFNTTNSWNSQLISTLTRTLISLVIYMLPIAALLFIIEQRYTLQFKMISLRTLFISVSFGSLLYALMGILTQQAMHQHVIWPPYIVDAVTYIPGVAYLIRSITQAMLQLLIVAGIMSIFSKIHTHRWLLVTTASLLLAFLLYPADFAPLNVYLLLFNICSMTLAIGLALEFIVIDHPELLTGIIFTSYILDAIRMIFYPTYIGVQPFALLTILVFVIILGFIQIHKGKVKAG